MAKDAYCQSIGNFVSMKIYLIGIAAIFVVMTVGGVLMLFLHPSGSKAVVNGIFNMQGSIPPNSTITLLAKDTTVPGSIFLPVATNLPAANFSSWQFTGAVVGRSYQIKAQMITDGTTTDSNIITVTAPIFNQVLSFNAPQPVTPTPSSSGLTGTQLGLTPTATPQPASLGTPTPTTAIVPTPVVTPVATPSATASISGTVTFTGQPPVSSRIVIFERVTGTTNFQTAVDNLAPYASSIWIWQGIQGTSYDFIAILKQKQSNGTDIDLVSSSTISLTSPASTGVLSLSYTPTLSAPNPDISVVCGSLDGPSQNWNASIYFQTVTGAASYWFEIGTTDGGTDLMNSTYPAVAGASQVVNKPLKNGTTYYAKYAYAGVANINSGASQFSPLSATAQLKCQ